MANVYSLVCFGGRAGLTVTMTIATPCVVTLTNHGLRDGTGVVFSTTGALPTGITAGATYYARSTAANTFNLYETSAQAIAGGSTGRINTSVSQSGTHTIKGAYFSGLTSGQLSRYGSAGSERIYAGVQAWRDARYAASPNANDTEICEIGEAFTETITVSSNNGVQMNIPVVATVITTTVNGVRSAAFHGGVTGAGYRMTATSGYCEYGYIRPMDNYLNCTIDGLSMYIAREACIGIYVSTDASAYTIKNNLIYGNTGQYQQQGIHLRAIVGRCYNNIVHSIAGTAIYLNDYSHNLSYNYNNLAAKSTTGFLGFTQACRGYYYNNISIGNTTNWGTEPTQIQGGAYNAGASGNTPWETGSATSLTVATTDFNDYTNNDYSPDLATSPQVNAGQAVYNGDAFDMLGKPRPAFKQVNGNWQPNTTWSVGPIEWDFGGPSALVSITLQNVKDGSRYRVYNRDTSTEIATGTQSGTGDITISNVSYSGSNQTLEIDVRKGSASPKYEPFETLATLTINGASAYISQKLDGVAA